MDEDDAKRRHADSARLDMEERRELLGKTSHQKDDRGRDLGGDTSTTIDQEPIVPAEPVTPIAVPENDADAPGSGKDPWDWEPMDEEEIDDAGKRPGQRS